MKKKIDFNKLTKICEEDEFIGTFHLRLDKFGHKCLWRGIIIPDYPLDSLGSYKPIMAKGRLNVVINKLYKKCGYDANNKT